MKLALVFIALAVSAQDGPKIGFSDKILVGTATPPLDDHSVRMVEINAQIEVLLAIQAKANGNGGDYRAAIVSVANEMRAEIAKIKAAQLAEKGETK